MEYIKCISIRYNVICNKSPKEQERVYNKIACKIASNTYSRASHVKNSAEFKKLYSADEEFISIFKNKRMPYIQTKKKIKYLLSEIENSLTKNNLDIDEITIEHILPAKPNGAWIKNFGDDWEDAIDRIGNMTLLSRVDNKNVNRLTFNEKKQTYQKSDFSIAKEICKYEEWDRDTLNRYQEWLAKQAANAWKIDFSELRA